MARRILQALVGLTIWLCPSVLRADTPRAWEGTIMIPSYVLGAPDPNPPFRLVNRHDIYPYPMLDDLTDQREMKSYRAIFLENDCLRATILPDLGGRLYSLFDKLGKREVFYRNHVVKYGLVALRGAWISGGLEFNFPNGHTTLTVSPVAARLFQGRDGSASVVVGAMDWVTDMHWEVALTLRPHQARLEQRVTLFNSTPLENLYWYWANAAVPATDAMQFDYPMREANPHIPGEAWTYPVWRGVDYSWYKNIRQPTSLFGRQVHRNSFGAYYHDSDFGVAHVADYRQVPGKKIWSWGVAGDGLIWTGLLTDHDGPYNEIQSGRYETQLTQEFMPPRRVESWTEYWYPVRGLGSAFLEATDSLALALNRPPDSAIEVAILPTIDLPNLRVVLRDGDKIVREFGPVSLQAGVARKFASEKAGDTLESKRLTVDVEDQNDRALLHWSGGDPIDGNPDFVSGVRQETGSSPAGESVEAQFLGGIDQEKRGNEAEAIEIYRRVLDRDPGYMPALLKLAWRSYRSADFAAAESFIGRGFARSENDPDLQYAAGMIYGAQGRSSLAQNALWTSIHFGGPIEPALAQLGEIAIHERRYDEAAELLRNALDHEPEDALARTDLAVALRLGGHGSEARQTVDEALARMPLFPFALAEAWRLKEPATSLPASGAAAGNGWDKPFPHDVQYTLDVAAWYLRLGDLLSANNVLRVARDQLPAGPHSPFLDYYLSYVNRRQGAQERADKLIALGSRGADEEVFPSRIEDEMVLADCVAHASSDGHPSSLLGTFLFARDRYDDAAKLWQQAVDLGFDNSVIERNLGVYAWHVKKDLRRAAAAYAKAIRLAPEQYRLYPELDEIYSELGDTGSRTQLFASAPEAVLDRDVVRARRTLLLVERGQFDEALSALKDHHFKPWEGGQIIREMYVLANVEKGRKALQTGSVAEAEQDFRHALEYPENLGVGKPDRPADAQPLYWLGEALASEGKTDSAQAAWRQAAEESAADSMTTRVYRAASLLKLGQNEEGRSLIAEAVGRAGKREAGAAEFYAAGLAEDLTGNQAEARRDMERALEADPSFWQARVELKRAGVPPR